MKHTPLPILIVALLASCVCGCLSPASTDQQKLDSARQVYTNANNIVSLLIVTGYIAKNDQALKDAILQTSATIRDALTKAQEYLTAGNKLTFQFWYDRAFESLAVFLQYQADGERKHRLSNPTTRPALPAKVSSYGGPIDRSGGWRLGSVGAGRFRAEATRRYA